MVKKISYLIIIFLVFTSLFTNTVLAKEDVDSIFNPDSSEYGGVEKTGIDDGMQESEDVATNIIANFIVLFRVIGVGTAIIILMSLGAKFILGSVEQRAEVKKHLVPYVIGAFVLFGGTVLLGYLQDFMQNFN